MSNQIAYILNLSTCFNAGNYLYYFFPSIASGKIMQYRQLTKTQLPSNAEEKKAEINKRFNILKNDWHLYRLDPTKDSAKLQIHIILDYNEWSFMQCSPFNAFPFAKMYYIQSIIQQNFSKTEIDKIKFQYFLLEKQNQSEEKLIANYDKAKALLPHHNTATATYYLSTNDFQDFINKEYTTENTHLQANVNSELQALFDQDINTLCTRIGKKIVANATTETTVLEKYLATQIQQLKANFASKIKTHANLNQQELKENICKQFTAKFSSNAFLRQHTDLLFYIPIDDSNTKSQLQTYEQLVVLLVESIHTFGVGKEDAYHFWSLGGENNTFRLENIAFNEPNKNKLFALYNAFAEDSAVLRNQETEEKENVKQFQFSSQTSPESYYALDKNKQISFENVNELKKAIPFFYHRRKIEKLKEILKNNTFQPIEEKINTQSNEVSRNIDLNGNELPNSTESMNLKTIEEKIKKLNEEEKNVKLVSEVDKAKNKFKDTKKQYNKERPILEKNFLQSIRLLPKLKSLAIVLLILLVLAFLLASPLYSFSFINDAITFASFTIILVLLASTVFWCFLRKKIVSHFTAMKTQNKALYKSFKYYVQQLMELAVDVRKSTLRRKNLKELKNARQNILNRSNQRKAYQEFYTNIVNQLKQNEYRIEKDETIEVQETDYKCSPYYDYRLQRKENIETLTIKYNNSEKTYNATHNLSSTLNIVKSIELN